MSKYVDTEKLKKFVESIGLTPQKSADYNDGRNDVKMVVLDIIDSLQQEQPKVDLEKEIDIYLEPIQAWQVQEAPFTSLENCARHFCEVGLHRAAEMYDNIEYNRQRAKEEPNKSLEEEYKDYVENDPVYSKLVNRIAGLSIARHFAEWQKEQDEMLKVNYEGARAVYDDTVQHFQEKIDEKYEQGKKDMKEQMLKDAVEAIISQCPGSNEIIFHNPSTIHSWEFPWKFSAKGLNKGDKVRIVILKEKEE